MERGLQGYAGASAAGRGQRGTRSFCALRSQQMNCLESTEQTVTLPRDDDEQSGCIKEEVQKATGLLKLWGSGQPDVG